MNAPDQQTDEDNASAPLNEQLSRGHEAEDGGEAVSEFKTDSVGSDISPTSERRLSVRGRTESVVHGVLHGWVFDSVDPGLRPRVEVLVDGVVVGCVQADRFRDDLVRAGHGDGRHAFAVELPPELFDDKPHDITARLAGTTHFLRKPLIGKVLAKEEQPEIEAAIVQTHLGRVSGYCIDKAAPDKPMQASRCRWMCSSVAFTAGRLSRIAIWA